MLLFVFKQVKKKNKKSEKRRAAKTTKMKGGNTLMIELLGTARYAKSMTD